jgi:hypothetical protein
MHRHLPRLKFSLTFLSFFYLNACESQLLTSTNPSVETRPAIDPIETLFAAPGETLTVKGKNLSSRISLRVNEEPIELTIQDKENASFTLPEGGDGEVYRLSFVLSGQILNRFSLAKTSGLASLPVLPIGLEFICDDLIFKDQSGAIVRGERRCGSTAAKDCSSDGETGCLANDAYKAAKVEDAAQKIISGKTLAGVSGSVTLNADCTSDGQGNCVVDGMAFKAAKLSIFSANDIRSSARVAGIQGSLPNCSSDGELGCLTIGPSFAAANLSGASSKILSGQSLAGIPGTVPAVPANCSVDNDSGCVATPAFPAVVKANLSAGVIKAGTIVAGVIGAYPSSTYPLASSTAMPDLTSFQSQLTTNGNFEFFDSSGARFTGAGDADLIPSNIRSGMAIESLSLNGIMPAVLPAAPTTLATLFFTSPDRMVLNWTPSSTAVGYMLLSRPGAAVSFVPNRNQIYTPGVQGADTILYVGSDLTFIHNGIVSGNSYNYALYSYDANRFYSAVPVRAINTSQFCQGLVGGTWVAVPGDATYGTSDFCVQKFEAKDVSSVPTSQASLTPWVSVSQTSAVAACRSLGPNYDLISNPEWLTIGANIAQVASNWSSGTVGVGTVNRGHSDNSPSSSCAASSDDTLGWVQTDCTPKNSSGDVWSQKRTHTLSTGAVIWDLSGNVCDLTNYVIANNNTKPFSSADGAAVLAWRDFTVIDSGFTAMTRGELTPTNAQKSFWNDNWASQTYGMGRYLAAIPGSGGSLARGSNYGDSTATGIFSARLDHTTLGTAGFTGFRCVAHPPSL